MPRNIGKFWKGAESHNIWNRLTLSMAKNIECKLTLGKNAKSFTKYGKYWKGSESHEIYTLNDSKLKHS